MAVVGSGCAAGSEPGPWPATPASPAPTSPPPRSPPGSPRPMVCPDGRRPGATGVSATPAGSALPPGSRSAAVGSPARASAPPGTSSRIPAGPPARDTCPVPPVPAPPGSPSPTAPGSSAGGPCRADRGSRRAGRRRAAGSVWAVTCGRTSGPAVRATAGSARGGAGGGSAGDTPTGAAVRLRSAPPDSPPEASGWPWGCPPTSDGPPVGRSGSARSARVAPEGPALPSASGDRPGTRSGCGHSVRDRGSGPPPRVPTPSVPPPTAGARRPAGPGAGPPRAPAAGSLLPLPSSPEEPGATGAGPAGSPEEAAVVPAVRDAAPPARRTTGARGLLCCGRARRVTRPRANRSACTVRPATVTVGRRGDTSVHPGGRACAARSAPGPTGGGELRSRERDRSRCRSQLSMAVLTPRRTNGG